MFPRSELKRRFDEELVVYAEAGLSGYRFSRMVRLGRRFASEAGLTVGAYIHECVCRYRRGQEF